MGRASSSVDPPFEPAPQRSLPGRLVPVSRRLRGYGPGAGRRDLVAGLTVAALALPSAMAYAEVAGLSPVHGLYALLLPCVAYALLGSSRQVIVGPEGALAALLAAAILPTAVAGSQAAADLAALLALLTGALFVLARVARLGWLADYLSRPVLIGYIHGVVVILIVGQLPKLLGISVDATQPIPQLVQLIAHLGQLSVADLIVSALALGALLVLRRLAPRFPAALVVVAAAVLASGAFDLAAHGVAVVGQVPGGLPRIALPSTSLADAAQVAPAAIGLFLVTLADGILTARAFAGKRGESIDVGQELLALGVANAASGFSQGMSVGVSGSRTAVNDSIGARSQVAGLVAAGAIAIVLLFLTAPIAHLPKAVLGAVIVVAASSLVDLGAWRELRRTDRVELAMAAVTTGLVVVTGVLMAIAFAVALSIVDVVRRSARPHDAVLGWVPRLGRYADVSVHRDARVPSGVVVYRLDDRLFFANADYFKGRIEEAIRAARGPTAALVLDAEGLTHVDSTGVQALVAVRDSLAGKGTTVLIARARHRLQAHLEGVAPGFGATSFQPTVRAAVAAAGAGVAATTSPEVDEDGPGDRN
jgi:sulfate permease, SulP family